MKANPSPQPTPPDEKPGQITTIWADGTVTRTAPNGRSVPRPAVPPIRTK